ncbi:hypothetical protein M408DRAFT_305054 [Serendipita vermifera MAFF 305830]|uniref:Uncharacterized protein n=1 Tax=Serendipita vermifera MAFF 305830 TaxID=933852 RepID=A0A0C3AMI4_SERVB|nr:hypothetical protein M408DRAFT_305054 [Serendipita vermifera MAFF 305830]
MAILPLKRTPANSDTDNEARVMSPNLQKDEESEGGIDPPMMLLDIPPKLIHATASDGVERSNQANSTASNLSWLSQPQDLWSGNRLYFQLSPDPATLFPTGASLGIRLDSNVSDFLNKLICCALYRLQELINIHFWLSLVGRHVSAFSDTDGLGKTSQGRRPKWPRIIPYRGGGDLVFQEKWTTVHNSYECRTPGHHATIV